MGAYLYFKTKFYEMKEQRAVKKQLYGNELFRKADQALLKVYRGKNPYLISKNYLLGQNAPDIYTYGETPLTTALKIAQECSLSSEDRIIEMGAGRGRAALFFAQYLGAKVQAYEKIPTFVELLKKIEAPNLKVFGKDMFNAKFSWATVIYLYGTLLVDPEILDLIKRFPKDAKIITVSYPLSGYSKDYQILKTFTGRFPWGETEIYLNGRN